MSLHPAAALALVQEVTNRVALCASVTPVERAEKVLLHRELLKGAQALVRAAEQVERDLAGEGFDWREFNDLRDERLCELEMEAEAAKRELRIAREGRQTAELALMALRSAA